MEILLTIFIYLSPLFSLQMQWRWNTYTFNQKILQGKLFCVLDGDTIEVKTLPAKLLYCMKFRFRVRLINIDALKRNNLWTLVNKSNLKPCSQANPLPSLIPNRPLYGRIISRVLFTTNGTDASRFVVRSGAAWVYERYNADESLPALLQRRRNKTKVYGLTSNPVSTVGNGDINRTRRALLVKPLHYLK